MRVKSSGYSAGAISLTEDVGQLEGGSSGKEIYLALSGGGVRAMVFHAGVLKFLAEQGSLDRVKEISTVSGGTLLTGLIFSCNGMKWPSDDEYISKVMPMIQEIVMTKGLKKKILSPLFYPNPLSWLDRIHRLSVAIERIWSVDKTLADLPQMPKWIANATSAETGKRFYFSDGKLECYKVGEMSMRGFSLSRVMAISAAVPGVFGPFEFRTKDGDWKSASEMMTKSKSTVVERFDKLRLYDGGVYDNLGLEQFLRPGRSEKRDDYKTGVIIVSDAGAPLSNDFSYSKLSLRRLRHVYSITADQVRALRVADFMRFLRDNPGRGAHIRIGEESSSDRNRVKDSGGVKSDSYAAQAASFETELRDLSESEWKMLSTHGYEASAASIRKSAVKGFGV